MATKAFLFFITFIVIIWTTSAQNPNCNRTTCTTRENCNGWKCNNISGTCMPYDHAINPSYCPNGYRNGWGQWCKWYRKCKCCRYPTCRQGCVHGICTETDFCQCDSGWHGPRCNTTISCDPACQNGGTCIGPNVCECTPGWKGPTCEDFYCNPQCAHGGTCIGPNDCECPFGWTGPTCEEFECNPKCEHGGNCTGPNECECTDGWNGAFCQDFFCEPPCENGGTCSGPNECTCPGDYHGEFCQYIVCLNRQLCIGKSGTCYAKNNPILTNTTACPEVDNGKKWCTPMCACCFGA